MNLKLLQHPKLINVVFFDIAWFACVIGRTEWLWATAPLVLAYTLYAFRTPTSLMLLVLVPAVIGIGVDSLLVYLNVFNFGATTFAIPLWLIFLWVSFATTLSLSLSFLGNRIWYAVVAGALGFPFSYLIGAKLGAVSLGYSWMTVGLILAVLWAVLLPILFKITRSQAEAYAAA